MITRTEQVGKRSITVSFDTLGEYNSYLISEGISTDLTYTHKKDLVDSIEPAVKSIEKSIAELIADITRQEFDIEGNGIFYTMSPDTEQVRAETLSGLRSQVQRLKLTREGLLASLPFDKLYN